MSRMAVDDGIEVAVVTPHIHPGRWSNTKDIIEEARDDLQDELDRRGVPLKLGFAAEVRLTDHLMEQVQRDEIPFYGEIDGYRLMLLEFPHSHVIPGSDKIVRWLVERGIRPMIAHPERNKQVMSDSSVIYPFVEAGCWLQCTAGSLVGRFGERAQRVAEQLLVDDRITFIASDAHNTGARSPKLREALDHAETLVGRDKAQRLLLGHRTEPHSA